MTDTQILHRAVDRRTLLGLAGAVVFAYLNRPLFEWFVAQSPEPAHAESPDAMTFPWASLYFLGCYLLPVAVAYVFGPDQKRGLVGVLVYVGTWQVVAPPVPLGSDPHLLLVEAVVLVLLGVVFSWVVGRDVRPLNPGGGMEF